jgi:hypothetical protein
MRRGTKHGRIGLLALVLAGAPWHAATLDFNFGSNAAELDFYAGLDALAFGESEAGGGILFNEDGDVVASGGFRVRGSPGASGKLELWAGIRAWGLLLADREEDEAFALALGGGVRYRLPVRAPLSLGAELHHAPDIVTAGDVQGVLEGEARVELELMPTAVAYVGYRRLEAELDVPDDIELDDGYHAGIRFRW